MTDLLPSRRPTSRHWAGVGLSVVALLASLEAVAGWAAASPFLLQPVSTFPVLRPLSALCIVAFGAGALALFVRRPPLARLMAIVVVLLAIPELLSAFTGLHHPLEDWFAAQAALAGIDWRTGTSMLPAIASPLIAFSLWTLSRPAAGERELLLVTVTGMLFAAVALAVCLVNASAITAPRGTALLSGSVQGMLSAMLLGVTLLIAVADRQEVPRIPPRWTPEIAGLVSLTLAVVLWRSLEMREQLLLADQPEFRRHLTVLPQIVLILGVVLSALITLVLQMLRESWVRARELEMTRVQRALETATDGEWEYDYAARRMRRSSAQLRHLGFEPAAFARVDAAWEARVHPDDLPRVRERLRERLRGGSEADDDDGGVRYRVQSADNSWHTIIDRGRVIERDPAGTPRVIVGISADITERMRADEAREASERRFRAMFNSALHGQILLDLTGRCEEVNATALAIVGATRASVIGHRLVDGPWFKGLPATQSVLRDRFDRAAAGEPTRFDADAHLLDGALGLLECSFTPLYDDDGTITQVLTETRDITERRRAEEALREIGALSTIGRLVARVAHEINNPLAGIQNSFLLIADAVPPEHPHFRFVAAIEREIQRIATVTRQLYETYRPEEEHSTESSLILAVNDAVSFLDNANRGRGVRILSDLSKAPSRLPVPDAVLRQTLYNLLQNAVEASPLGGVVHVRAELQDKECVLTVSDSGIGIDPAIRDRIWDPFFSTKDPQLKTSGIGLGLALVRQSVQAVGGTISLVDDHRPGTSFEVRLPMVSVAHAQPKAISRR